MIKTLTIHKSRGQSLVEFALVLPVLLMLMMGVLDFGRVFFTLVALHDAADEGATYAAIRPNDLSGVQERAAEASTELVPVDPTTVAIVYPGTLAVGQPITVTVSFPFELYTPFVQSFFENGELVLRGVATHPIISIR